MNKYLVFNINEEVEKIPLTSELVNNLEKTISDILKKASTKSIKYYVENKKDKKHPINSLSNNIWKNGRRFIEKNFEIEAKKLAERLLEVELKKDGSTRKKNITKGMLFFKGNKNQVTIIKLESTEIMDNKTFELKEALNLDKHYYKITTIKRGQLDNINIIDRNKTVSKFWADEFLQLEKVRDSSSNTTVIFEQIKQDSFFTDLIKEDKNYRTIKQETMEFLEKNKTFTEEDLFKCLTIDDKEITSADIINDFVYDEMDDDFDIDKTVVFSNLKGKLKASSDIDIFSNNLVGDIRDKNIILKGNKLEIRIQKKYLDNMKDFFDKNDRR
ncbi:MAG: hypothetical protein RR523_14245 [Cetobacterium sp.]|uniref:hypothetical protein n=1 Tax=Cetobacterium sp. TaxID=2071632 RepID=UPI002FC6E278